MANLHPHLTPLQTNKQGLTQSRQEGSVPPNFVLSGW